GAAARGAGSPPTVTSITRKLTGSEKERKHGMEQLLNRQKYIIDVAQSTAQKFILEGEPGKAIPAGLQALRFSIRVYGACSVDVVPAYLLLAEACMDAGCLMQATTYLSQAQWLILKTPACSLAVQLKLHRDLGLLYAAKGDLEQSLYHLANDIYLASCAFGPDAVQAAEGYFHMAKIFLRQNKTDVANSLFAEVTAIWHAFLLKSVQTQEQILKTQAEASPFDEDRDVSEEPLTEAQQTEAIQALNTILDFREKAPKQQPDGTAKVLHSLAMLYYLNGDLSKAREMGAKALDLMKQLPQQESLEAVDHLLNLINSKPCYGK
ncbi:zinc finger MYND domain-containing protein 12, partial [Nothoprocta perdicaria]|uniref:zinc finger MYND domain-containing protein 12 n=1 Tax=Nothoprocta perdicaria TaxID=30464 RepID=UPI000E1B8CEF